MAAINVHVARPGEPHPLQAVLDASPMTTAPLEWDAVVTEHDDGATILLFLTTMNGARLVAETTFEAWMDATVELVAATEAP